MKKPIKVAITGATGNISYNAIFRLAAGEAFGVDQPISLHLYDLPGTERIMEGIVMELTDCCTSVIADLRFESDLDKAFHEVDYALLVGAKPRGPGMERSELLRANGVIFVGQGQALNRSASRDVKVIVVGNPCNTNCLVAMHHAPDLKRENFHAMLRLDQNRAAALLASKAGALVSDVERVIVWGNHSATQVPDVSHATIKGKNASQIINDPSYLEGAFMTTVQKRGAEVISFLGRSSAGSAAKALIDSVRDLHLPTPKGEWFSSGVCTDHNPYGLEKNLVFGLPCRSLGHGKYEIIPNLPLLPFIQQKMVMTQNELIEERKCCAKEKLIAG